MTVWSLEPGCERPVLGFTRARGETVTRPDLNLTADQLVDRIREVGGRVDVRSDKICIYPEDRTVAPLYLTLRHADLANASGAHRQKIVAMLQRIGIDIVPPAEEPIVPTPADIAKNGHPRPRVDTDGLLAIISELETRLSAAETANANLSERADASHKATLAVLARLEKLERAKETHRAELDIHLGLIENLASGPARPPSLREVLRGLILEYLRTIPGTALTPQMIENNLRRAEKLPADLQKTAIASACASLAERGEVQYGGKTGPDRGLYWVAAE